MICYFEISQAFSSIDQPHIPLSCLCLSCHFLFYFVNVSLLCCVSSFVSCLVFFPDCFHQCLIFPSCVHKPSLPCFLFKQPALFFSFALWTSSTTSVKSVFCVKICLPLESVFGSLNCIPIFLFQHKSRVITSCQSPKEIFFEMLCFFSFFPVLFFFLLSCSYRWFIVFDQCYVNLK